MKKISLLCVAAWCVMLVCAQAQNFKGKAQRPIAIEPPAKSLEVGERLKYSVEWLGVPIAQLSLHTQGIETINGRRCYHIHAQTAPNSFFRRIYDAVYTIDTWVDVMTMQPVRFEKVRQVKGVVTCVVLEFDQQAHSAKFSYSTPKGSAQVYNFFAKRQESVASYCNVMDAPAGCQDVFSALYYFRTLDVAPGKVYPLTICYGDKLWNMDIQVNPPAWKDIRKRGTMGVFEAAVSSELNYSILGKRKLSVVFAADTTRVPLEFSISTMVGALRAVLQNRN